jgi:hypothetical protein
MAQRVLRCLPGLLLVFGLGGCNVDLGISPASFSCDSGGPCSPDSGPRTAQWSTCIAQEADVYTCNIYCQSISKTCVPSCSSGAYNDLGVESFMPGSAGCTGSVAGARTGTAGCSFQFTDSMLSDRTPRWACCCL